jgi:hypothetical protein
MKNKLTCKLRKHIVTSEGDFIPEGTPVIVFGWGSEQHTIGKIECRAAAYVYADSWECSEINGHDRAAVGDNFWIAVKPEDLTYAGYEP